MVTIILTPLKRRPKEKDGTQAGSLAFDLLLLRLNKKNI